jgi:5-methylcytosine-specific restriction enzyme A
LITNVSKTVNPLLLSVLAMSTNRSKEGGWIRRTAERGPNGRGICRWCRTEVPSGRRTFCCDTCVHDWRLRTDPGYLREQVFARDRGVCSLCALDTMEIYGRFRSLPAHKRRQLRRRLDIPTGRENLWDADHIVSVAEGGGECSLENLRTLCIWCHQNETAKLRRRLSETRRHIAPAQTPR